MLYARHAGLPYAPTQSNVGMALVWNCKLHRILYIYVVTFHIVPDPKPYRDTLISYGRCSRHDGGHQKHQRLSIAGLKSIQPLGK